MSTQSPHPPTPKGSRNNRRPQKKNMTPQAQKPGLSTPPSSPPGNITGGIQTDSSNNLNSTKKKQAQRSVKKPRETSSPATHNGYYNNGYHNNGHSNGPRNTPNHASVTSPQMKDSAAYAGPTFHASPAPSSLPMPKFFPKSAPDADLVPPLETDSDSADLSPESETTPSKHRSRNAPVREEPKGTALDFMFEAAMQAKENKATSSPDVRRPLRSPQTEPPARHNSNGMFASNLGNDYPHSSIGPSFAPSYQERMAALRPSSVPQSPEGSEAERKAKTEQLKDLLLNPRPQKPPSQAPFSPVYGNVDMRQSPSIDRVSPNLDNRPSGNFDYRSRNFDAHASNVHPFATPSRAASGPPMTSQNPFGNPPPQPNPHLRNPYLYPSHNSPLREVAPAPSMPQYHGRGAVSNGSSPGPYSHQYRQSPNLPAPWQGYASPQPTHSANVYPLATHSSSSLPTQAMDTQQIENDIRRVLKLDASSTFA